MRSFKDKVAAITGSASGIGRELALALAAEGCHLSLSDINEAGLAQTHDLVARRSPAVRVTTARVDVSDRDAVFAWAARTAKDHDKVNLIFNNAGVVLSVPVEDVPPEDFQWIMNINFWGVVWGTQAFLPHLRAAGEGHVVNVSSVLGLVSRPLAGTYSASKFAVRGFTEALRMELELEGPSVSATCVHPGGIKTGIARTARLHPASARLRGTQDQAELIRRVETRFITSAESAAAQMLKAVRLNKRRLLIGRDAKVLDLVVRLLGPHCQRLILMTFRRSIR
jgi:NAD(P)-dependent dehydrogenase (short-subunit alcohol dehydrogenase family)